MYALNSPGNRSSRLNPRLPKNTDYLPVLSLSWPSDSPWYRSTHCCATSPKHMIAEPLNVLVANKCLSNTQAATVHSLLPAADIGAIRCVHNGRFVRVSNLVTVIDDVFNRLAVAYVLYDAPPAHYVRVRLNFSPLNRWPRNRIGRVPYQRFSQKQPQRTIAVHNQCRATSNFGGASTYVQALLCRLKFWQVLSPSYKCTTKHICVQIETIMRCWLYFLSDLIHHQS